jgi:hypothetical protein
MTSDLYPKIVRWLDIWDQALSKPTDILLRRSFANLVSVIERALEKKSRAGTIRIKAGREYRLLEWLAASFDNGDPEIALFRQSDHISMSHLEQLLKLGQQQQSFEIAPLLLILNSLTAGVPFVVLKTALTNELSSATQASSETRLGAISRLLLDQLLAKHSVDGLKEIPSRAVAMESSRLVLRDVEQRHKENPHWTNEVLRAAHEALASLSDSGNCLQSYNASSETLTGVFDTMFWE